MRSYVVPVGDQIRWVLRATSRAHTSCSPKRRPAGVTVDSVVAPIASAGTPGRAVGRLGPGREVVGTLIGMAVSAPTPEARIRLLTLATALQENLCSNRPLDDEQWQRRFC